MRRICSWTAFLAACKRKLVGDQMELLGKLLMLARIYVSYRCLVMTWISWSCYICLLIDDFGTWRFFIDSCWIFDKWLLKWAGCGYIKVRKLNRMHLPKFFSLCCYDIYSHPLVAMVHSRTVCLKKREHNICNMLWSCS